MSTTTVTPAARGQDLSATVERIVAETPVWDLHTHLFTPAFGTPLGRGVAADPDGLMLWGIDELVTYHYLIAEVMRELPRDDFPTEKFWTLSQQEQADLIWRKLFVESTPLSEARRGVVTTLTKLGLDPHEPTLDGYRKWFAEQSPEEQINRVLEAAGVERVTMTNELFDPNERQRWLDDPAALCADGRFVPVLRFDTLVVDWPKASEELATWGYRVDAGFGGDSAAEVGRMLDDWIVRIGPAYCAMSLPPDWRYPADNVGVRVLTEAILPACERHGLAQALMVGVTRGANPALRLAGDSVGSSDVESVASLCRDFSGVDFMVTLLARENQHELAVAARKFRNLLPFGCWWFLNNPSLIDEITRMRMELLGTSFVPQHSDCRVLEQLVYKWDHSRRIIATVLTEKYADLAKAGWRVDEDAIQRDAHRLLYGETARWLKV
ncbi:MAG: glucuronate isomerase [Planctomycetota bacterium]